MLFSVFCVKLVMLMVSVLLVLMWIYLLCLVYFRLVGMLFMKGFFGRWVLGDVDLVFS